MDINLGAGMDGTEAAAAILKEHDLPVVFLSSPMFFLFRTTTFGAACPFAVCHRNLTKIIVSNTLRGKFELGTNHASHGV
jgi:hypothetical protein